MNFKDFYTYSSISLFVKDEITNAVIKIQIKHQLKGESQFKLLHNQPLIGMGVIFQKYLLLLYFMIWAILNSNLIFI